MLQGIITHLGDGLYSLVDSVSEVAKPAVASKFAEEVENECPMTSMSTQRATELQVLHLYKISIFLAYWIEII